MQNLGKGRAGLGRGWRCSHQASDDLIAGIPVHLTTSGSDGIINLLGWKKKEKKKNIAV